MYRLQCMFFFIHSIYYATSSVTWLNCKKQKIRWIKRQNILLVILPGLYTCILYKTYHIHVLLALVRVMRFTGSIMIINIYSCAETCACDIPVMVHICLFYCYKDCVHVFCFVKNIFKEFK